MEFVTALWLPIVLTAVALFFASSIAWTVLPHHQSDWKKSPGEDQLLESIRKLDLEPGGYLFPYCSHQDAKDPAMQERYKVGPRGLLSIYPIPNMGRNLGLTFVYFLIIAFVTAYIAWNALGGPGVPFRRVFQIVGAIGVLTFASSGQLHAIWFHRRTFNDLIDGIVYGVIMGLIFAYFWPSASGV